MKRKIFLFLLVVAMIMNCKTTKPVSSFTDVIGKEWKLIEIQLDGTPFNRIVLYDRNDLKKNNVASVYTMSFNTEMVSGTGAPNKYSAPYTLGDGNSLKIAVMRSTLMAPLVQPEKLQEQTFYNYMQNVEQWSVEDDKLILQSKADNGNVVKLVFVQ